MLNYQSKKYRRWGLGSRLDKSEVKPEYRKVKGRKIKRKRT